MGVIFTGSSHSLMKSLTEPVTTGGSVLELILNQAICHNFLWKHVFVQILISRKLLRTFDQ